MSTETIDYRFKARGGEAANLAAVNEVPLRREVVVEIDTAKIKVGDGVTPYNDLAYVGGGGGGGGLTHWSEAVSDVVPNATVAVASFTSNGPTANADAALVPKGIGAVLAAVPDSAVSGGNKRGRNAVDWQTWRESADQVAFGAYSAVGGGYSNKAQAANTVVAGGSRNSATGQSSAIGGGSTNTASGNTAVVGGGYNNQASDTYATVSGGTANKASANYSTVGGGQDNEATGQHSWIGGGQRASTRGVIAATARAGSYFAVTGDCQTMAFVLKAWTSNATQVPATANGSTLGTATNQVLLPDRSAYLAKGCVVARQNTTGDTASWEFTAHIKRDTGAATTALVAPAAVTQVSASPGAAAWVLDVVANTSTGALAVNVTGEASKSIKWTTDVYSCVQVVG